MASGDFPPYMWPGTSTVLWGHCQHGVAFGSPCFYCQHPALGPAVPQTFQMAGWTCPGCLRCYSPALTCCPTCPQQKPADPSEQFAEFAVANEEAAEAELALPVSCTCHTEGGLCGCGEDGDEDGGECTGGRHCSC